MYSAVLAIIDANGGVVRRKSFANTYSTNVVEGPGHSWNPGLFVDVFVEWWPVGKLTATKAHKLSQNFVEGIFDALTSYKPFLLTPFVHTPSIQPSNYDKLCLSSFP